MQCIDCDLKARKHGRDRHGNQRYRCGGCGKTFQAERERPLGDMRLPLDKATLCLNLLLEGSSVRATSRVTGVHKDTILRLLVETGEACERFLAGAIQKVAVKDVQVDELWGFISMKERTRVRLGIHDQDIGDAYCFIGIERDSKLVLAWHLGRRTHQHTDVFIEKLERATEGRFQLTSDGFSSYPGSINYHLGTRTDYATLTKLYGHDEEERRYTPPRIIGTEKEILQGSPDPARICTSHIERLNLSLRTQIRRLTRLTICFSRCWRNHKAALALFFAFYNYCRIHKTLRVTPAMAAGIAVRPWSIEDLLRAATH